MALISSGFKISTDKELFTLINNKELLWGDVGESLDYEDYLEFDDDKSRCLTKERFNTVSALDFHKEIGSRCEIEADILKQDISEYADNQLIPLEDISVVQYYYVCAQAADKYSENYQFSLTPFDEIDPVSGESYYEVTTLDIVTDTTLSIKMSYSALGTDFDDIDYTESPLTENTDEVILYFRGLVEIETTGTSAEQHGAMATIAMYAGTDKDNVERVGKVATFDGSSSRNYIGGYAWVDIEIDLTDYLDKYLYFYFTVVLEET